MIHSPSRTALPFHCIGTLRPTAKPTVSSPTLPAQLYINWSSLLSRQRHSPSLSHCLGPVTPCLLPACTLIIISSSGNRFHCCSAPFVSMQTPCLTRTKSTLFHRFRKFLQNRSVGVPIQKDRMANIHQRWATQIRWHQLKQRRM